MIGTRPRIAELAARLGAEKLGKMPAVTAVLVEEADPQSWFIGGKHRTHPVKTPERGKSGSDFEFRQLARERVDARPMA